MALAAGQPQQAVADAEPAKPYSAVYPASYLQGLAYLQMHDAGNAVNAFKAATQYRAAMLVSGIGVPAIPWRNWGWRGRMRWQETRRTRRRRMKRCLRPGRTRMQICPCWWRRRRSMRGCSCRLPASRRTFGIPRIDEEPACLRKCLESGVIGKFAKRWPRSILVRRGWEAPLSQCKT